MSNDEIDFDEFDDDDHLMGWELQAQGAAEDVISDIAFDSERGVVIVDGDEYRMDDFDSLASRIAEAYDEQWYANVPFDGGEAVFDSDSQSYAEERLDALGFFTFFETIEGQRSGKLILVVAEQRDSGILIPRSSAIELQDLGLFTSEQIAELHELIASSHASEADFQRFFERYPQFLSRWNHPSVHPHVRLNRSNGDVLIPDFVLCNTQDHKAAIVDLKLPAARLVSRQKNRDRWSAAIYEARTQLLRYRDWFDDQKNRESLISTTGMEIYKPSLAVLVGHGSEFRNAFEKQQLVADLPDIEIVTYDELASWASRRQVE